MRSQIKLFIAAFVDGYCAIASCYKVLNYRGLSISLSEKGESLETENSLETSFLEMRDCVCVYFHDGIFVRVVNAAGTRYQLSWDNHNNQGLTELPWELVAPVWRLLPRIFDYLAANLPEIEEHRQRMKKSGDLYRQLSTPAQFE